MAKFGFIGMGNMGYAMLKGLLSVYTPSDIIFTCPDLEKCKRISRGNRSKICGKQCRMC